MSVDYRFRVFCTDHNPFSLITLPLSTPSVCDSSIPTPDSEFPVANTYARLPDDLFVLSICSYANEMILNTNRLSTRRRANSGPKSNPRVRPCWVVD